MLKHRKASSASILTGLDLRTPGPSEAKGVSSPRKGNWSTGLGASVHESELEENEERLIIEPKSFDDPKLKKLIQLLMEWINNVLHNERIIVQDLEEDLYDGQVLQKLVEKLTGTQLNLPEISSSEKEQRSKLQMVLEFVNKLLDIDKQRSVPKWSIESVHTKNIVAILHLLVSLALHFRAPFRIPENVIVSILVVTKTNGSLVHKVVAEQMTAEYGYDDLGRICENDAFDTLFNQSDEILKTKLDAVKNALISFVNDHLSKINCNVVSKVTDLDKQFADGVYLCLLIGILEGYFIPLYDFYLTPKTFDEKVSNVAFAFELMQDAGLPQPKPRPEDIVNLDIKSTLRVLYSIFLKYKHGTSKI